MNKYTIASAKELLKVSPKRWRKERIKEDHPLLLVTSSLSNSREKGPGIEYRIQLN